VTGTTGSPNFPTTSGAFQTTIGGGRNTFNSDAFVAKIVDVVPLPSATGF
jgi:hypothetical protein